jgi:hypothetical protein
LSRRDAPLTVGALEVMLDHDVAWAGVPPELVRTTVQAAILSTAGKVTAAVVSAEVAALAREVLKTILLNKLKLTAAVLVTVFVVAGTGSRLSSRTEGTASPDQTKASPEPREQASLSESPKKVAGRKLLEDVKKLEPPKPAESPEKVARPKSAEDAKKLDGPKRAEDAKKIDQPETGEDGEKGNAGPEA